MTTTNSDKCLSEETLAAFAQIDWDVFSDMYAFLGNRFLVPASLESSVGFDVSFWESVPSVGNAESDKGLKLLIDFCSRDFTNEKFDKLTSSAVEYAKLFIGPPAPLVQPCETFYVAPEVTNGFGEPTFEVKRKLAELHLQVSNENNQYEDHIGIELLVLAELAHAVACSIRDNDAKVELQVLDFVKFARVHILSWMGYFADKLQKAFPEGYYYGLALYSMGTVLGNVALIEQELA